MPGDSDGLAEGSADGLMIGLADDNVAGELRCGGVARWPMTMLLVN
jgi:hypothetical protein